MWRRVLFLALLLPFPSLADEHSRFDTMTVRGEAITKIAPDQLSLPVTVHEENASLKAAKERHDENLRRLLKLAADLGIPKEKIQTSFTAVNPVYDYEKDSSRPRLRGYTVETSLDFRITDFARLGDFMNGAIAAGIDQVGSVSYSLQDEEKVRNDTLNRAMEQAYAKASRLAATARVALDRPLVIDEGDFQMAPPMAPRPMMIKMAPMSVAAEAALPQLPSGVMEIRQSVTVTYSLK